MSPDDRTTLLEELPPETVKGLIASLSPTERAVAQKLLGYPEGSVGRLMTPDFVAIKSDWTVQQVLDDVRARGRDSETINVLYVLDDHGKLIDDLRIREFLTRPLDAKVSDLMNDAFVSLVGRRHAGKRRRPVPQIRPHRPAGAWTSGGRLLVASWSR